MARTLSSLRRSPLKSVSATIRLRGKDFTFKLSTRPLPLGPSATIQYYWLDSRHFRHMGTEASAANFRNCVGHWAAAMHASGLGDDLEQQTHYVTAVSYPLLSSCKSLQNVYRDAYLAPRLVQATGPLPKALQRRIRDIVAGRDRFQIQEELDQVLGRFDPPARVVPLLQEAFRHWVGKGVVLLRQRGNDGLKQFLGEADYWLSKYRKRSGQWARHFINLFAYEAKVSFYRCYANAWVDLIPWLREHCGLDSVSERFLRLWHHQNQPVEIPHGRTLGGIYYPTHGRATVMEEERGGPRRRRALTWETSQIGPTHVRDVFSGQVLSLHPLSAFFMQDPEACAAAGRFITCEQYDAVMVRGQAEACSEYWDLIGAIVTAAHRYRQALDEQQDQRPVRPSRSGTLESLAGAASECSEAFLMEDFADSRKVRCPGCSGKPRFQDLTPPRNDSDPGQANFRCEACAHSLSISFHRSELVRFLPDPDE